MLADSITLKTSHAGNLCSPTTSSVETLPHEISQERIDASPSICSSGSFTKNSGVNLSTVGHSGYPVIESVFSLSSKVNLQPPDILLYPPEEDSKSPESNISSCSPGKQANSQPPNIRNFTTEIYVNPQPPNELPCSQVKDVNSKSSIPPSSSPRIDANSEPPNISPYFTEANVDLQSRTIIPCSSREDTNSHAPNVLPCSLSKEVDLPPPDLQPLSPETFVESQPTNILAYLGKSICSEPLNVLPCSLGNHSASQPPSILPCSVEQDFKLQHSNKLPCSPRRDNLEPPNILPYSLGKDRSSQTPNIHTSFSGKDINLKSSTVIPYSSGKHINLQPPDLLPLVPSPPSSNKVSSCSVDSANPPPLIKLRKSEPARNEIDLEDTLNALNIIKTTTVREGIFTNDTAQSMLGSKDLSEIKSIDLSTNCINAEMQRISTQCTRDAPLPVSQPITSSGAVNWNPLSGKKCTIDMMNAVKSDCIVSQPHIIDSNNKSLHADCETDTSTVQSGQMSQNRRSIEYKDSGANKTHSLGIKTCEKSSFSDSSVNKDFIQGANITESCSVLSVMNPTLQKTSNGLVTSNASWAPNSVKNLLVEVNIAPTSVPSRPHPYLECSSESIFKSDKANVNNIESFGKTDLSKFANGEHFQDSPSVLSYPKLSEQQTCSESCNSSVTVSPSLSPRLVFEANFVSLPVASRPNPFLEYRDGNSYKPGGAGIKPTLKIPKLQSKHSAFTVAKKRLKSIKHCSKLYKNNSRVPLHAEYELNRLFSLLALSDRNNTQYPVETRRNISQAKHQQWKGNFSDSKKSNKIQVLKIEVHTRRSSKKFSKRRRGNANFVLAQNKIISSTAYHMPKQQHQSSDRNISFNSTFLKAKRDINCNSIFPRESFREQFNSGFSQKKIDRNITGNTLKYFPVPEINRKTFVQKDSKIKSNHQKLQANQDDKSGFITNDLLGTAGVKLTEEEEASSQEKPIKETNEEEKNRECLGNSEILLNSHEISNTKKTLNDEKNEEEFEKITLENNKESKLLLLKKKAILKINNGKASNSRKKWKTLRNYKMARIQRRKNLVRFFAIYFCVYIYYDVFVIYIYVCVCVCVCVFTYMFMYLLLFLLLLLFGLSTHPEDSMNSAFTGLALYFFLFFA